MHRIRPLFFSFVAWLLFPGVLAAQPGASGLAPGLANGLVNGVANAAAFPGGDAGAQIDAAFASLGGASAASPRPSATVVLPPGMIYTYATPVRLPNPTSAPFVQAPILDCQGSTLNFTGTGDAIVVSGEAALGTWSTGEIRNCVITSPAAHSKTVTSLIHIQGRVGFTLSHLRLSNARWCVDWEDTDSTGGPGFNEEDDFEHIQSLGCVDHIHAHNGPGGTGSFEYNRIVDWHFSLDNSLGPENGLALAGGGPTLEMQGSLLDLKTNSGGSGGPAPVALLSLGGGTAVFRSVVLLHGENTGHLANAYAVQALGNAVFYNAGDQFLDGFRLAIDRPGAQFVLHPPYSAVVSDIDPGGIAPLHVEAEAGAIPQRRCMFDIDPSGSPEAMRLWLASYGGRENDCEFQVLARDTDNANRSVYTRGSGAAPVNILYTNGQSKSVGLGPGYGPPATGGAMPQHTLEVNGTIGNRSGSFQVDAQGNVTAANLRGPALAVAVTTTAAPAETFRLPGMSARGHCSAPGPTNASAAQNVAAAYVSAKGADSVTLTHAPVAGMSFDLLCTPY